MLTRNDAKWQAAARGCPQREHASRRHRLSEDRLRTTVAWRGAWSLALQSVVKVGSGWDTCARALRTPSQRRPHPARSSLAPPRLDPDTEGQHCGIQVPVPVHLRSLALLNARVRGEGEAANVRTEVSPLPCEASWRIACTHPLKRLNSDCKRLERPGGAWYRWIVWVRCSYACPVFSRARRCFFQGQGEVSHCADEPTAQQEPSPAQKYSTCNTWFRRHKPRLSLRPSTPSRMTVTFRVPPSGRTQWGFGRQRGGDHFLEEYKFGISAGCCYPGSLTPTHLAAARTWMTLPAAWVVTRKTEAPGGECECRNNKCILPQPRPRGATPHADFQAKRCAAGS